MPEVVNWHPAAVHFPLALGVTATLLLAAARLRPASAGLDSSARLLLALAALSAVAAVTLGWLAYGVVDHDAAGHAAMIRHRDWALASTAGLLLAALWDGWRRHAGRATHGALLPVMLAVSGALVVTGGLGGELVYRHGIGVATPAAAAPTSPAASPPEAPSGSAAVPAAERSAPNEHVHKDGSRHRH